MGVAGGSVLTYIMSILRWVIHCKANGGVGSVQGVRGGGGGAVLKYILYQYLLKLVCVIHLKANKGKGSVYGAVGGGGGSLSHILYVNTYICLLCDSFEGKQRHGVSSR